VKTEATEAVRVPESTARQSPVRPATYSITAPAVPAVERIFTAERTLVDVTLRGDPDRPLPEFPTSPWSRVLSVDGDATKGAVIHMELKAYGMEDDGSVHATIPVTDPQFASDLETNAMLACHEPIVKDKTKQVVDSETDARKAAQRIADFVFKLEKRSGAVAEATAPEILRDNQGDCSEHARLFVSMCRAAGIPARTCSGFVCIASEWGAHAWAEIWVGRWIGVDPTTCDVGTAARYIFYGYEGKADSTRGVVSSRASGRMRLAIKHLDEGDDHVDIGGPETWTEIDRKKGRARHHLAGIDLRDIPVEWTVNVDGDGRAMLRVPHGIVTLNVTADQGSRHESLGRMLGGGRGFEEATFGGAPAWQLDRGARRMLFISSRRRVVRMDISASTADELDEVVQKVEKVIAPTFAPRPTAPAEKPATPPAAPTPAPAPDPDTPKDGDEPSPAPADPKEAKGPK
jgi:hypothetical protein